MPNLSAFLTTDDIPTDEQCLSVFMPSGEEWLARVMGALSLLIYPENWEKFGSKTPDECADAWLPFFDRASFHEGNCRVVGEIITYAGSTSPDARWLPCDGSSYLRADYPDLFAVIGTTYGFADSTHFNLPDLQGRVPLGSGTGSGLSAYTLGQQAGEETHTLTTAETPAHSHVDVGHTHPEGIALPAVGAALIGVPIPSAIPGIGVTGLGSANLSNTGGSGAHNNIEPILAVNFLIVALP